MHRYRTHTCGDLSDADIGTTVRLSGWCNRIRDHGGVLFIDLRDHYGLTQCVVDPDSPAFAQAEKLRSEWVIRVEGPVRHRPVGTENAEMPTGRIEIYVEDIEVLGPAAELPMPVATDQEYPEETRLRYRFLDLRRERLHKNIILRSQVIDALRTRMKGQGFTEFQTPILTASSPEGARDYLVPSRVHPGKFYALPQAPQQFKQLIMVAGFDRYFQIAPCFRDEDARADRSPGEFYQLDIEMSFVTQEDVFNTVEPVLRGVFEEFGNKKNVTQKFPRIAYSSAIRAFGSDKPDLRNPILIHDVTEMFRDSNFGIFAKKIESDSSVKVWAIPAPGGGQRSFCDRMVAWAKAEGQPGFANIFWREIGGQLDSGAKLSDGFTLDAGATEVEAAGPVAKNIGPERTKQLQERLNGVSDTWTLPHDVSARYQNLRPNGLKLGDAVFFVIGRPKEIYKFAGLARQKIASELKLIPKDVFEFCWVVDFPMYEYNEEEKKIDFSHNPFSMPQGGLIALETQDPLEILAYQYDIVCNGTELSSGAIRNHRPDIMKKAFAIAGHTEEVLEERFGGMYRAFQYGSPPHGGIAPGVDRIVMLLAGEENLREVVLFPMNQRAEDLLMGAPAPATPKQLRELHIRLNLPE